MADTSINNFLETIATAQSIALKFHEIMDQQPDEKQTEDLIEFAQALGFEITAEELNSSDIQVQDLDDEELDAVVGGCRSSHQQGLVNEIFKKDRLAFEKYQREHPPYGGHRRATDQFFA